MVHLARFWPTTELCNNIECCMIHALRWFPSSWLVLSCLLCSFFLHKCDALLFLHRNQNYVSYTSTKCTIRPVCFSYEEEQFCHQKVQDIKFLLCRKLKYWKGLKMFLWMIWMTCFDFQEHATTPTTRLVMISDLQTNSPFYSYVLGCQAFEQEWGYGWPCYDTNPATFQM